MKVCDIDGCDKPARSAKAAWCKMHYHRWYRHGSTDKVAHRAGISVSSGRHYKTKYVVGHPVAAADGKAYVHRVVLYDAIGAGPHPCYWCATPVDWLPRGEPNCLQVDHLNGHTDDNRVENLAPSCGRCNAMRALQARSDALRDAGWWSQHDTIEGLRDPSRRRNPRVA